MSDEEVNYLLELVEFPNKIDVIKRYFNIIQGIIVVDEEVTNPKAYGRIVMSWVCHRCNSNESFQLHIELHNYNTVNDAINLDVIFKLVHTNKINIYKHVKQTTDPKREIFKTLIDLIAEIKRQELNYAIENNCPDKFQA